MAIVGLKMVTVALVDDNQKIIKGSEGLSETGLVEIDDSMFGTKTANITNLEGPVTKVSGNNKVQDVYTAPGAPQIAFDFNNLAFDLKQKLKGYKPDIKDTSHTLLYLSNRKHLTARTLCSLVSETEYSKRPLKMLVLTQIWHKLVRTIT